MLVSPIKQYGNSLVELMISMTLGLASITAMASLVGHGIALNTSLLAKSRLVEEINAVAAVISHDLKRAGYYAHTKDIVTKSSEPWQATVNSRTSCTAKARKTRSGRRFSPRWDVKSPWR